MTHRKETAPKAAAQLPGGIISPTQTRKGPLRSRFRARRYWLAEDVDGRAVSLHRTRGRYFVDGPPVRRWLAVTGPEAARLHGLGVPFDGLTVAKMASMSHLSRPYLRRFLTAWADAVGLGVASPDALAAEIAGGLDLPDLEGLVAVAAVRLVREAAPMG